MLRIITSRVVLALLGIAFLLLNPAGICAGNFTSDSPSHPCCPKPAAMAKAPCVCIDRQSEVETIPTLETQAQVEAATVVSPASNLTLPVHEFRAFQPSLLPAQDRVVSLHQILV